MLQLVNRFRTDPQGELSRLVSRLDPIRSFDGMIQQQLDYWRVDGSVLARQWQQLSAVPPLIWNAALYDAAQSHNAAMIAFDDQRHQFPGQADPGQRMRDAGYDWRRWGENIYAYPRSLAEAHGGFVINWGAGPHGIQDPPSHRLRMLTGDFVEVGIAVTPVGASSTRSVGPLVVTQDFAAPRQAIEPHVVGAVFRVADGSRTYRAGHGVAGARIVFEGTGGVFETQTMSAGGFQLALPPGTYRGVATGGGLELPLVSREFVVGSRNVSVDFVAPLDQGRPPVAADDLFLADLGEVIDTDILANDRDPDGMLETRHVQVIAPPQWGELQMEAESGRLTYRPQSGFAGADSFTYRLRDDQTLRSNVATVRILVVDFADMPWNNPWQPLDVNADASVTALDALLVINALNQRRAGELPPRERERGRFTPFVDVNRDGHLSPIDALYVINYLNRRAEGEGEGEPISASEQEAGRRIGEAPGASGPGHESGRSGGETRRPVDGATAAGRLPHRWVAADGAPRPLSTVVARDAPGDDTPLSPVLAWLDLDPPGNESVCLGCPSGASEQADRSPDAFVAEGWDPDRIFGDWPDLLLAEAWD